MIYKETHYLWMNSGQKIRYQFKKMRLFKIYRQFLLSYQGLTQRLHPLYARFLTTRLDQRSCPKLSRKKKKTLSLKGIELSPTTTSLQTMDLTKSKKLKTHSSHLDGRTQQDLMVLTKVTVWVLMTRSSVQFEKCANINLLTIFKRYVNNKFSKFKYIYQDNFLKL